MSEIQPQLEQTRHHLQELHDVHQNVHQNVMGNDQGLWGIIHPPAGDVALQGGLRDPRHCPRHVNSNVPHYHTGMGFYPPPPPDGYVFPPMVHDAAGPTQTEGVVPGLHRADNLNHANPNVVPGPAAVAQEAVALPPDEAVGEFLRRIVIRLLGYPDSQPDTFRVEPGAAGRVRVSISFETAPGNVHFMN